MSEDSKVDQVAEHISAQLSDAEKAAIESLSDNEHTELVNSLKKVRDSLPAGDGMGKPKINVI